MAEQALEGIKVLDLSEYISGPYCTKMLGTFGAEVIKIEKPGEGDGSRRVGPFLGDVPHPERSAPFLYLNTIKKSVTLNLKTQTGLKIFKELIKTADVLVENSEPQVMPALGLDYETLERINSGLVMTSISRFGQSGPYRDYGATSIVSYALSGHLNNNGEPDREPLQGPGPQPDYQGGLHGFLGTMAALYSRDETGLGQWVDVSIMECMAGFHQYPLSLYTYSGEMFRRSGNRYGGDPANNIYPCKDGYVALNASTELQFETLFTLIGMPELTEDPRFQLWSRRDNADALDALILSWVKERTKDELFHTCSEWRLPCTPVSNPEELLNDPQYQARGYWVEVDHPETGKLTYPGAPFKMSETPWQAGRAPLLGEHNQEIYCQRLGYTRQDLVRLREAGII